MLISPALAHGASGAEQGGYGPLVLLAVAAAAILYFVIERKIRGHRSGRDDGGP